MLTPAAARERILAGVRVTESERVSLAEALGRVPASGEIRAAHDVPPFANSAMDGVALRAADAPGRLKLGGEIAAGSGAADPVEPGCAVRIMTGAPIPPGADAVIPVEQVEERDGFVTVPAVTPGAWIREAGHDTRAGERIMLPVAPLTSAQVAVLASLGLRTVDVRRRPVVAVLSTGDELVAPGELLRSGQIHDANGPALAAAAIESGAVPHQLPRVGDDPEAIRAVIRRGVAEADLLVASGGVSVGRHDHVREAIEALGRLDLWRIAMQPGKPLAFGEVEGTPVLGLPGNPVSALVTFELFARPLIRAMQGLSGDGRARIRARATAEMGKDADREAYLRVRVHQADGGWIAEPAGGQSSSQLRPLAAANALLVVPAGEPAARAGTSYDAILLGGMGA